MASIFFCKSLKSVLNLSMQARPFGSKAKFAWSSTKRLRGTKVSTDVLISEATFGLPIYRWPAGRQVAADLLQWWRDAPERASLLFCYAFGKAQRLLAELHQLGVSDTVLLHGAMVPITQAYRDEGIAMVPTEPVSALPRNADLAGRLVLAPPSPSREVDRA